MPPEFDLLSRWRDGDASASELLDIALANVERANPALDAIITVTEDLAREQARAVDAAASRGHPLPLRGMPVTRKDNIDVVGLQIVAPWWRDDLALGIGAAYQRVTDWHLREPPSPPTGKADC